MIAPPKFRWLVPLAAVAVLVAMRGWTLALPDPAAGAPFRAHVRQVIQDFPTHIGDWRGVDVAMPKEAVALLHPNAYLSRQYVNTQTGDGVSLLFLEVEDSRDMMGHYPPNCYPANGWDFAKSTPAHNALNDKDEWIVGDLHLRGRAYEFRRSTINGEQHLWVRNFFILPNNTFYPEIGSFGRAAANFQIRPYGATQVQVVYERECTSDDRERIFQSLIAAHRPLLDAVRMK